MFWGGRRDRSPPLPEQVLHLVPRHHVVDRLAGKNDSKRPNKKKSHWRWLTLPVSATWSPSSKSKVLDVVRVVVPGQFLHFLSASLVQSTWKSNGQMLWIDFVLILSSCQIVDRSRDRVTTKRLWLLAESEPKTIKGTIFFSFCLSLLTWSLFSFLVAKTHRQTDGWKKKRKKR